MEKPQFEQQQLQCKQFPKVSGHPMFGPTAKPSVTITVILVLDFAFLWKFGGTFGVASILVANSARNQAHFVHLLDGSDRSIALHGSTSGWLRLESSYMAATNGACCCVWYDEWKQQLWNPRQQPVLF